MATFDHIDTWLFDLDGTLYDAEAKVFPRMRTHMAQLVSAHFGISTEEAVTLCLDYWRTHGSVLRGLKEIHGLDPHAWASTMHDFDISDVEPCNIVRERLSHLPGRRIIFTNAPRNFAHRMVAHLGIKHHFEDIFAIEDTNFMPKPHHAAFETIINKYGIDPKRTCMFEDSHDNLKTAADFGMTTVWLYGHHAAEDFPHVHYREQKLGDWLEKVTRK